MRITSKGQVTIPQAVREQAGLLPFTEVEFVVERGGVRIVKAPSTRRPSRGAAAVERLRRSGGHVSMSTDEIMALTRGERVRPVLVDSNVLLDVITDDPAWGDWSAASLQRVADEAILVINALIYAEVSVGFAAIETLEDALPPELYRREPLPYEAAFLAGKAFRATGSRAVAAFAAPGLLHRRPRGGRRLSAAHP